MTHYTENCSRTLATHPVGLIDSFLQTVRQWICHQRLKADIQRERDSLLTLSDSMLRDIGIDRATADHEARRRDIPASRNYY